MSRAMSDGKHGQQKHVETNHSLIDIQRPETEVEGLTGHPPKKITSKKKYHLLLTFKEVFGCIYSP